MCQKHLLIFICLHSDINADRNLNLEGSAEKLVALVFIEWVAKIKEFDMLCYFSREKKREDPSQHANCVLRGPLKQAHHLGGPLNMQIAC